MAPVVESSGTQSATISTEHTLLSVSTAKTRVLTVNLRNMGASDRVEVRIYNKTLTGDTMAAGNFATLAYIGTYQGTQSEPVVQSVPVPAGYASLFTLTQTAGTGRTFDWNVLTLD